MVAQRWPDGVSCPKCGSGNVLFLEKYNRWHCREKHEAPQFTLKTGTVMEDSPIGLDKWLPAFWLLANCKNGISSYELHRALGVTQKTAWFMLHRIRVAMEADNASKLGGDFGPVEVDETFWVLRLRRCTARSERPATEPTMRGRKSLSRGCLTANCAKFAQRWFQTSSGRPCRTKF